jgi:hypothetical protein
MDPSSLLQKAKNAYIAAKNAYDKAIAIITTVAVSGVETDGAGSFEVTIPKEVVFTGSVITKGLVDHDATDAGSIIGGMPMKSDAGAGFITGALHTTPTHCFRSRTVRAGSIQANGAIKDVSTKNAGSFKVTITGAGAAGDGHKGAIDSRIIYLSPPPPERQISEI